MTSQHVRTIRPERNCDVKRGEPINQNHVWKHWSEHFYQQFYYSSFCLTIYQLIQTMGMILQFCRHIIPLNSLLCLNTELSCVLKDINNTDDDLDDDRVEKMGSDLTLDSWDETRICLMAAPPSLNITEAPPHFGKSPPLMMMTVATIVKITTRSGQ